DVQAPALVVSQFTLYADVRKGRRPSWSKAARPEQSEPLYEYFVNQLRQRGLEVATGQFGAMMDVSLVNTGPFTIVVDSDELAAPRRGGVHSGRQTRRSPILVIGVLRYGTLRVSLCGCFFVVLFGHVVDTGFSALLVGDRCGRSGQWIVAISGLGERDDFADGIGTGQQRDDTVPTKRDTAVRWCAILEGIQEETEFLLCLLVRDAHDIE